MCADNNNIKMRFPIPADGSFNYKLSESSEVPQFSYVPNNNFEIDNTCPKLSISLSAGDDEISCFRFNVSGGIFKFINNWASSIYINSVEVIAYQVKLLTVLSSSVVISDVDPIKHYDVNFFINIQDGDLRSYTIDGVHCAD